jgi:hypothetical protein
VGVYLSPESSLPPRSPNINPCYGISSRRTKLYSRSVLLRPRLRDYKNNYILWIRI